MNKVYEGIEVLRALPHGYTAEAVEGPYKGKRIEHCLLAEAFFWDEEETKPVYSDDNFDKTFWMIIPMPIEFNQVKADIDAGHVVRCDLPNQSRIFWDDGERIATRKMDGTKVSYATFLFFDEIWDGKWSVYPKEV